uniref:Poly [ADP-ribose] polymerase n=1 Tax=Cyprinodon variegatus TaxID=28743 RepID=A0A3Q2CQT3_CYPVA
MSSLGEVEDMDTWDTPWYWYYLEDCGRWHRFEVNLYVFYRSLLFCSCVILLFPSLRMSPVTLLGQFHCIYKQDTEFGPLGNFLKKKQLMRIQNVTEIPERRLFHGTDTKNVDSICKYNFDLRIPKINGRSYGNGIYFAVEALYAGRYSSNSTTSQHNGNTKPIFLARVLVGKFKLGRSSMQKPDDENQYLSCVNDINHPKIFVIFDPNQIYPEYLIEYQ